jgi:hypothetical protein
MIFVSVFVNLDLHHRASWRFENSIPPKKRMEVFRRIHLVFIYPSKSDIMLVKKYGVMTTSTLIIPERPNESKSDRRNERDPSETQQHAQTLGPIHRSRDTEESFRTFTARLSSCTCLRHVPGFAEAIYNRRIRSCVH